MNKILLTGANGFIGSHLLCALVKRGFDVTGVVREVGNPSEIRNPRFVGVGNLEEVIDWGPHLEGVDAVIHTAGLAHSKVIGADASAKLTKVNVDATQKLLNSAITAGVKRFVFISTIKVNGNSSSKQNPFSIHNKADPKDLYGLSKLEAENAITNCCQKVSTAFTIIRPPLVYGKNLKGNLRWLEVALRYNLPLPFGLLDENRRSFISLDNLSNFTIATLNSAAAENKTFIVSDGAPISTKDLTVSLRRALNSKSRIYKVSPKFLRAIFVAIGKNTMAEQLIGDLVVDDTSSRRLLDWTGSGTTEENLVDIFKQREHV